MKQGKRMLHNEAGVTAAKTAGGVAVGGTTYALSQHWITPDDATILAALCTALYFFVQAVHTGFKLYRDVKRGK